MTKSKRISKLKLASESKNDFWLLAGLQSNVRLSDRQLKEARKSFSKNWADINNYF